MERTFKTSCTFSDCGGKIEYPESLSGQATTCPHCNRDIANNLYGRYHGDNCKQKP